MEEQEISIFPMHRIVYATFWQRFGAYLIDILILALPIEIIQHLTGGANIFVDLYWHIPINGMAILNQLLSVVLVWIYSAGMEASPSQATIGKQVFSLTVTDLNNERISFARATGRHFSKIVSTIILLIGFFMVIWDHKNQALHDKMAGTLVVKKQGFKI